MENWISNPELAKKIKQIILKGTILVKKPTFFINLFSLYSIALIG